MTHQASRLLNEALQLSDTERSDLAAKLIESLDPSSDDGVEAAWDEEIRRRLDELDQGTVRAVPWFEGRRLITEDPDDTAAS